MKQSQRTTGLMVAGVLLVGGALYWNHQHNQPQAAKSDPGAAKPGVAVREPVRLGTSNNLPVPGPRGTNLAGRGAAPGQKGPALPVPAPARRGPTNAPSVAGRPVPAVPGRTNAGVAAAKGPGKTGPGVAATSTNAPASLSARVSRWADDFGGWFNRWKSSSAFFPSISATVFGLILLSLLFNRARQGKTGGASNNTFGAAGGQFARRQGAQGVVNSCNVLQVGEAGRMLWNFGAKGDGFALSREHRIPGGEALPRSLIARDWRTLLKRKLNIAWLPPENVFLRVVHLPASDFNETVSMVELQLEKLSPLPVAQVVWSLQILPQARENEQTIVVILALRSVVEEFLGQLEGQGFLADRLEVPALDQLQATAVKADGVWLYPSMLGGKYNALAAWWYDGVLQTLGLVNLPATQRAAGLKEQLMQMAWAGELEGWLTSNPTWHLVADPVTAADWEPGLREGLGEALEIVPPESPAQLAALTASRATRREVEANLLPTEFTTRYQQRFVDHLWLSGIGLVIGGYLLYAAVVGVEVAYLTHQTNDIEGQVADLGPKYTNALGVLERYTVLADHQDLKFASLDCWLKLSELLPEEATLDSYSFTDGRKIVLQGSAPSDHQQQLLEFEKAMRKAKGSNSKLLFAVDKGDSLNTRLNPGGQTVTWSVSFELDRVEAQ